MYSKKEGLIDRRKKQILDAATNVFSKKGFSKTLMEKVAHLAKIGKGTIYQYFESKQNLFLSAVERGLDNLKDSVLREIGKGKSPLGQIENAVRAYLRFFESNPEMIGILLRSPIELQERMHKRYFQHYYTYIGKMEEIFREGQISGQIKKLDIKGAIGVLSNMLNGLIYMWQVEGKKYPLSERAPIILKIYFKGIVSTPRL